jgi:hypothetical protein
MTKSIRELAQDDGRVKVVMCKCGDKVTMACVMPFAETDEDVTKDFMEYAKQGRRIEYVKKFEWCPSECEKLNVTPVIQSTVIKNQLNLFE